MVFLSQQQVLYYSNLQAYWQKIRRTLEHPMGWVAKKCTEYRYFWSFWKNVQPIFPMSFTKHIFKHRLFQISLVQSTNVYIIHLIFKSFKCLIQYLFHIIMALSINMTLPTEWLHLRIGSYSPGKYITNSVKWKSQMNSFTVYESAWIHPDLQTFSFWTRILETNTNWWNMFFYFAPSCFTFIQIWNRLKIL